MTGCVSLKAVSKYWCHPICTARGGFHSRLLQVS